jgi:peptide-methionine (S)-S-oxide reductase
MFEFLKNIMNNQEPTFTNDINSVHRILKTDIKKNPNPQEDEIIFGCGCFWGAEKCFWKLPGGVTTSVGYAGGEKSNPTYHEVCSGLTGHSEVVRDIFNKSLISISLLFQMTLTTSE